NPHFDTHRMDYRDLGYPTQNLIPADNSQITALMSHSNGFIYGATSGKTKSYLFFYNRFINKVRPLGKIGEETGVYHCLLEGKNGEIYIGTGMNMMAPVKFTRDFPVEYEGIEKQMWKDIQAHYESYSGGHIFRYDPAIGDKQRYTNEDSTPLEDLGIPVAGNSVYAMVFNQDSSRIYGLSYPDANFFIFDLKSGTTTNMGDIMTHKVYGGPERQWRSVPRDLYCDPATGIVYTSGDNGFLLKYTPGSDQLELTYMRLPGEYWEGLKSWDYPIIEQFISDHCGNVYASTHDGYLLRLDFAAEKVIVLGKPRVMRRMRAMDLGTDNKIYMITGEFERSCKLHTYDLSGKEGFRELGPFAVDRSPYYAKRSYQFDALAIGPDGTVFCGESDRDGKLFFYIPGDDEFDGMLNPTNPVIQRQRKDTPALIQESL
ncbi:MAG: hypothetical protein KAT15_09930, partial [Bacteroidales bacterium]|nr:hypothetical protein [Bacteroidales bacterium]